MTSDATTANKSATETASPWFRRSIIALFIVAAGVRAIDVWRPVDGTVRESWRETDTGAIARNFYREDMNIFLPRIDWRGDGPGYVESEFPLYPWTVACLYHVFGYHEEILRLVSFALSLGSCLIFLRLASRLLPRSAALPAWAVFALSPMAVRMASAVQPEPSMFFFYLLAIDAFTRWIDTDRHRDFTVALVATTLAILAKVPAAHVGILFACLCIQKFGLSVVLQPGIWLFAVLSLGIPAAWYVHAHSLWLEYGNSLGISNEAYGRISSGSFLMTLTETIPGVIAVEAVHIWLGVGVLFGMLGIRATRDIPSARPLAYWLLALTLFYFVTGRTTGEAWAAYYHIVSAPVAAMLIGLGFYYVQRCHFAIGAGTITLLVLAAGIAYVAGDINAGQINAQGRLALIAACTAGVAGLILRRNESTEGGWSFSSYKLHVPSQLPSVLCLVAVLCCAGASIYRDARPNHLVVKHRAALELVPHVPEDSLIIVGGLDRVDQHGLRRAADVPFYLFWMDRKGFVLHDDERSIARIEELSQRGARYFVVEREALSEAPEFESALKARFPITAEHEGTLLIKVDHSQPAASNQAATNDASENDGV